MNTVDIALATYNGEKYIEILLDSIFHQTYQNFIVHVCDDGSRDATIEICKNHSLYTQGKLIIHEFEGGNGAYRNFMRALNHCKSEYIALCDQDDFWLPVKLERMINKIKEIEVDGLPVLIFSDLQLVDSNLKNLGKTFFEITQKSINCSLPMDFIFSNHIPGCCMLFNKNLKEAFMPMPESFFFHDWWIALSASFFGKVICIKEPLILYRQHSNNTVGIQTMKKKSIFGQILNLRNIKTVISTYVEIRLKFSLHINKKNNIYSLDHQEKLLDLYANKKNITEKFTMFRKAETGEDLLLSFLVWMIL